MNESISYLLAALVTGTIGQNTFIIPGQFSISTIDDNLAVYTPDLNVEGSDARQSILLRIRPLVNIPNLSTKFATQSKNAVCANIKHKYYKFLVYPLPC